jgi:pimeloyl-ACP methyl ester carboxylesterase
MQNEVQRAIDLWLGVPKRGFSARSRRILNEGQTEMVAFRDIELPVTQWGDAAGPLVLLVHGWGGHRAQLGAFVPPLLEAGYRAASFDAPAHGDAPGTHTNGFEFAAALWKVVERVGRPAAVIGHSLGTMAVNIALQQGLEVEKIVFTGALRRLSDALEPFLKMHGLDDAARAKVEAAMRERFGEDVWEVTALDKQLPKFDIPALLFHDKEDETTPYVSSVAIARAWPSAKLVTTQGLGHRMILRDKEVIAAAVAFLGE